MRNEYKYYDAGLQELAKRQQRREYWRALRLIALLGLLDIAVVLGIAYAIYVVVS